MTSPEINPSDVVLKITANIRAEVDAFLTAMAADADAPAYCREFIAGNAAIVVSNERIQILPFIEPPAEPEAPGQYL